MHGPREPTVTADPIQGIVRSACPAPWQRAAISPGYFPKFERLAGKRANWRRRAGRAARAFDGRIPPRGAGRSGSVTCIVRGADPMACDCGVNCPRWDDCAFTTELIVTRRLDEPGR